jgi:cytochrome c oxidase subunit II
MRGKKELEMKNLFVELALALSLTLAAFSVPIAAEPRVVEVTAKRFEFSPSLITVKKGEPVTLRLKSLDVTHGFFQKALGIDLEIEPGKVTDFTLTPKAEGRFVTICDHFCGSGHGNMRMTIVVE